MAFAAHADQLAFQNELSACVTITTTEISTQSNVVLANTSLQLSKPIGACGCFSALATYTSSVRRDGVQEVLQEGVIGIKRSGQKTLVLATEPALAADEKVHVRLACARPL